MRPLILALSFIALTACGNKHEPASAAAVMAEPVATADSASPGNAPRRYMAYEHAIDLQVEEERVTEVARQTEAACLAASAEQCVILESRISSGRGNYAQIRVRAKPAGIRQLINAMSKQGKIASQSTTAEDLAGPIEDADKKLAMLNDYRSKLEALRSKASNDIEAMISVNKELAQTQSEIEQISGARAHNLHRVNTEVLNLSISATGARSSWRPVSEALGDFTNDLARGLSGTITAMAYLIPWSLVFLLVGWIARALWRRFRKPATKPGA